MPNERPFLNDAVLQRDKLAMLGQLTAGIAHELNNPIGYIASNMHTLKNYTQHCFALVEELQQICESHNIESDSVLAKHRWQLIHEDLSCLLQESEEGASLLKALVEDLKTLGRSSAAREYINPNTCVRSALNVLNHQLKHHFNVKQELSELPEILLTRPHVIQACTNLIHNAVQAMAKGGELLISTKAEAETVSISVEDNGPGISEKLSTRIFEPYFSTKDTNSGSGLGLSIVQHIMHAHGGSVGYQKSSQLGGACFTLSFPIKADKNSAGS